MAGCRDAWMGSAQGLAVTADFALFVKQCLVLWQLAVFYELYIFCQITFCCKEGACA